MFERTFTFWRNLMSRPAQRKSTKEERRMWVRYPADMQSSVQLADYPGEDRVPTRIRDISKGGANLLVDKPFQTGQLLRLELPREDGSPLQVLACVVRSLHEETGKYSLGCVFSRELTEDDLLGFGARRLRHSPEDQRTWQRFECNLQARFMKIGDPIQEWTPAQVINISASGVGLHVQSQVEAGTLLQLDLLGKDGKPVKTILSCVAHTTHRGEHEWGLGCNFIRELSESDFEELVK